MKISVIIRTLNEEEGLRVLLPQLSRQDYDGPVEVIVVDNESTDDTVAIAKKHGARVFTIARDEFSYPKTSNLGASKAEGEILVFVSGHAEIIGTEWLQNYMRGFEDPDVVGIAGRQIAFKDAPMHERFMYWSYNVWTQKRRVYRHAHTGILGAANCGLRASYFRSHPFNEDFGAGGEDQDWADTAIKDGKKIVKDPAVDVYHSHRLSILDSLREVRYWIWVGKPRQFSRKRLLTYGRRYGK